MTVERRRTNIVTNPIPNDIEKLERRIAETRMTAALDTDWDRVHVLSREFTEQFIEERNPIRQIATASQIRARLLRSGDVLGLRALRLAIAAPMVSWLQDEAARSDARRLRRLLTADQRQTIPGLAHLEDELAQAQGR